MSNILRTAFGHDSEVISRAARRKSIGATTRGMKVIAKDVARQRVFSEWVGNLKFQPMQ